MTSLSQLSARLRELRKRLRLSQELMAHALGVTGSTLNRWENGHARPHRMARLRLQEMAASEGLTIDFGAHKGMEGDEEGSS